MEFRDGSPFCSARALSQARLRMARRRLYFAADKGPTVEQVAAKVIQLLLDRGRQAAVEGGFEGQLKGLDKAYLAHALAQAVARLAILEAACGVSEYHIHRDVAAERFNFAAEPLSMGEGKRAGMACSLRDLRPVYNRLKAEQKGFSVG